MSHTQPENLIFKPEKALQSGCASFGWKLKLVLGAPGRRGRDAESLHTPPQTSPADSQVRPHLPLEPTVSCSWPFFQIIKGKTFTSENKYKRSPLNLSELDVRKHFIRDD